MPQWFMDLTSSQWWAGSRQYVTFFAGAMAMLLGIGATQSQDLIKATMDFLSAVQHMLIALGALASVIVAIINAWKSAHNAGPTATIQRTREIAEDPQQPIAPEAKRALVLATSAMPELKQNQVAIVLDKAVPGATALAESLPQNVVAR